MGAPLTRRAEQPGARVAGRPPADLQQRGRRAGPASETQCARPRNVPARQGGGSVYLVLFSPGPDYQAERPLVVIALVVGSDPTAGTFELGLLGGCGSPGAQRHLPRADWRSTRPAADRPGSDWVGRSGRACLPGIARQNERLGV